jgi:hypothetical protein
LPGSALSKASAPVSTTSNVNGLAYCNPRSVKSSARLASCDQFELSVEPGANALDVFEHPYAYAAWRGVDCRLADPERAA